MVVLNVPKILLLVFLFLRLHTSRAGSSSCYSPDTIDFSLSQEYCNQPMFASFLPKTEEFQMLDNICFTYFPLPDDPTTFTLYQSRVFCDGSNDIQTYIGTEIGTGQSIVANPFVTLHDYVVGYAGCDTYIVYTCPVYGDFFPIVYVAGATSQCNSIGLSCLRKVEEVIRDRGLPDQDYYILPMKLPNRCVTQQLCLPPPNPFYNNLPSVARY